ncbi:MAG: 2-succinyl-6-hydroxy-2,4-cyclohexadiene-carboxylate synthase [Chlamydiota bacterium]|jgi:2-succinyl-6-hydroxy-2,4-cyclohexadiene-1-carboxylate synthase
MTWVLLHGFLGSRQDWDPLIAFMERNHPLKTLAINLPGHGAMPFDRADWMPSLTEPMHLVGYSMGGRLALQYTHLYPENVASLTLISTHFGLKTGHRERLRRDQEWATMMLQGPVDDFLRRWYDQPIFAGFCPPFETRRSQNWDALAKCLLHYSLAKQPRFKPDNALVIVGELDAIYRSLHPNAVVVAGAGHAVHLQNPQGLYEAMATHWQLPRHIL